MMLFHIIVVGFGGFFGAIARYVISKKLNNPSDGSLPIGTLTVNLIGSFFLGVITGGKADILILLMFGTGFIGAFTTFSTLKLEMSQLYRGDNKRKFFIYTLLTYILGIVLAFIGYLIGNHLS